MKRAWNVSKIMRIPRLPRMPECLGSRSEPGRTYSSNNPATRAGYPEARGGLKQVWGRRSLWFENGKQTWKHLSGWFEDNRVGWISVSLRRPVYMAHNIPDTTVPVSEAYGIKEILEKYLGENSSVSDVFSRKGFSKFVGFFDASASSSLLLAQVLCWKLPRVATVGSMKLCRCCLSRFFQSVGCTACRCFIRQGHWVSNFWCTSHWGWLPNATSVPPQKLFVSYWYLSRFGGPCGISKFVQVGAEKHWKICCSQLHRLFVLQNRSKVSREV